VLPLWAVSPAVINDAIYKPVVPDDPEVRALAESIRARGLLEPIVLTLDSVVLSGHRRRAACELAGLDEVPVRRHPILSTDPEFPALLVSFNEQRVKTVDQMLREAVVTTDPRAAYEELLEYRAEQAARVIDQANGAGLCLLTPDAARRRSDISPLKRPMLATVRAVVDTNRSYWPLTLRQVHYRLLNDPPLRNASKTGSRYANDRKSYSDLSDLLTRARLSGAVPWAAVHDPTRPISPDRAWEGPGAFIRDELQNFLRGYARNLLQSQPAYVEIVAEKQTVEGIIRRAAEPYTMRYMVGRGYSSIDARHQLAARFRRSGKNRLVLLFLGDNDPEGENIPTTFAASMRDEFGVEDITPVKVALTRDQVQRHRLPPVMTAKESSSRAAGFVAEHGTAVYELEALEPDELSRTLGAAIESVLDANQFNREREREAADALELGTARRRAMLVLGEFSTTGSAG
jgi:hypothetical protein